MANAAAPASFLWFDLETFGRDARRNRIAQFACVRTDAELKAIGEPIRLLCRLDEDVLPSPQSCWVTGLTPQRCLKGLPEPLFAAEIATLASEPNTCLAGFNNIRFDHEFLRFLFYRNFFDPYACEWQGNNSRFDLLDPLRLAYALRPEGLYWPQRADGSGPSFKLADLARANGIAHDSHDALGDVLATLELARKLKEAQPRLWNYALALRDKRRVREEIAIGKPLFYVSGRYPAERGCAALVLPLAELSNGEASYLVFDLACDPKPLLGILERPFDPPEALCEALAEVLAELPPFALKRLHPNRQPMVVPAHQVNNAALERLGIERQRCEQHLKLLQPHLAELGARLQAAMKRASGAAEDPELDLYARFVADRDRVLFSALRKASPNELGNYAGRWRDPRLDTLLFRYRARHYPETLNADEAQAWEAFRRRRYHDAKLSEVTAEQYFAQIDALCAQSGEERQGVIEELLAWADRLGIERPPTRAQPAIAGRANFSRSQVGTES